jgi:hypothetical protein
MAQIHAKLRLRECERTLTKHARIVELASCGVSLQSMLATLRCDTGF